MYCVTDKGNKKNLWVFLFCLLKYEQQYAKNIFKNIT